jgi:TonB family protein
MNRHPLSSLLLLVTLTSVAVSQAKPVLVHLSENVAQGLLMRKVAPAYPPLARQARIQGTVVLRVRISKSGDVENVRLVSGHPMLAPAAIEAVKQWKYQPYLLYGDPIEAETNVTVNFALPDKLSGEDIVGSVPRGITGGVGPSNPAYQPPPPATPQPSLGTPQRVRVSAGVAQAFVLTKVPPQYPPEAKDAHIQGVVLMNVIVDKEGNVANIQLISGHPLLAPAAIDAVKQWKYKPYLLNESPVEVETQVHVNFTLMP